MWLFLSLQAHCVCCGAFPQTNLTILSLLLTGLRLTGCTRHLQCCPMDFMSLLSWMLAWIFHGCFCLTESKCKSLKQTVIISFLKYYSRFLLFFHSWWFSVCYRKLLAGLIISALMTVTDYMTLFFSCHGLKVYGAWLNKYHSTDLWSLRILVK